MGAANFSLRIFVFDQCAVIGLFFNVQTLLVALANKMYDWVLGKLQTDGLQ